MGKPFKALTIETILAIHSAAMKANGGLFSGDETDLINKGSLEYIIDASLFPVYGQHLYPTFFDKTGALVQAIICTHIFRDGNKRTGLLCCLALCKINGYLLDIDKESEDFFVRIAAENLSWQEVSAWLKKHVRINRDHPSWLN